MRPVAPRDVSLEYVVPTSHGKKRALSPDNRLPQNASLTLSAHPNPRDSRVPVRVKQHGSSGAESTSIPPVSCRQPCPLWTRRHFDPRGQDSLEQRLGISLPNGCCLRDCGRRAGAANPVQSDILSSGKSWCLRTLAWSQLGLDRWSGDLPFRLQHRPTNLHLWVGFSESEVKEPCFHQRDTDHHNDVGCRLCPSFATRELLACRDMGPVNS